MKISCFFYLIEEEVADKEKTYQWLGKAGLKDNSWLHKNRP